MTILWQPTKEQIQQAELTRFRQYITERHGIDVGDYTALHAWSIDNLADFWNALWDYCDVIAEQKDDTVLQPGGTMMEARFFPGARLNFTENLLRRRDDSDAIVFRSETGYTTRLSWKELHERVVCLAQALRENGIRPGDRVAACMPNIPETVIGALAAAAVGATWASCSPDFGEQGILDRFQ